MTIRIELDFRHGLADPTITRGPGGPILSLVHGQTSLAVAMTDPSLLLVAAVFGLAGLVKGVIGLGLPTISMGLLAVVMPPVQAAAILALPSLITNLWQMLAGPALTVVARRLWPMMLMVCLGTWAGLGLMTGVAAHWGSGMLGVALALYAVSGLVAVRLPAPGRWEPILSPVVGGITGLITAATGVFVIPAVPYLQAMGLEKQELVASERHDQPMIPEAGTNPALRELQDRKAGATKRDENRGEAGKEASRESRKTDEDAKVDESLEESFPASDPPAY